MAYESGFASVYDKFTRNAEPEKRSEYVLALLAKAGMTGGILLDLACGTGVMTERYLKAGFDVIGVDVSGDMLLLARERLKPYGQKALLLEQDMTALDLYGTVNCAVCSLDSINHLVEAMDVQTAFQKVSLFTEPGGVFVFDVNTLYKHRQILGNNTFVYEDDSDFLVWQNYLDEADDTVQMLLDIFSLKPDGTYERYSDEIVERAYGVEEIAGMLKNAGFCDIKICGDMRFDAPEETEERIYFVAKKKEREQEKK